MGVDRVLSVQNLRTRRGDEESDDNDDILDFSDHDGEKEENGKTAKGKGSK